MKRVTLWLVVIVATVTTTALAMGHFGSASSVLKNLVRPGELSRRHAYLGTQCEACHDPSVGVTVAKCTSCHANAQWLLGRQPTAFHESIQECATCHVEHQGVSTRPLVMNHLELAQIGALTLERSTRRDPESARTLHSLETWLRIRKPGELDTRAARESLNCSGCHDSRDPHFKRFGGDCAQCHVLETWSISGYQHPSPRSTECVECHQPPPSHLMGHFAMVSQKVAGKEHARVDQCFECHNTTSWNDIVEVGFYKHH